jgi:ribA/ribD-fused uncharacterized protein
MNNWIYFYDADHQNGEFSNFFMHTIPLKIDGKEYKSVEHYFQSEKFPDFPEASKEYQEIVRTAKTPAQTKIYGGQRCTQNYPWTIPVKATIEKYRNLGVKMRDDWDQVKDYVMLKGLRAKFEQDRQCQRVLLATDRKVLSENAGKRDAYWGNGGDLTKVGKLGELLMQVREEIRFDQFITNAIEQLGEPMIKEMLLKCLERLKSF